jgi:hypothetical protein
VYTEPYQESKMQIPPQSLVKAEIDRLNDANKFNEMLQRVFAVLASFLGNKLARVPCQQYIARQLLSVGADASHAAEFAAGIVEGGAVGMALALVLATFIARTLLHGGPPTHEWHTVEFQLRSGTNLMRSSLAYINLGSKVTITEHQLRTAAAAPHNLARSRFHIS